MRLTDLAPQLYTGYPRNRPVAFTFNCPHCLALGQAPVRIGVGISTPGTQIIGDREQFVTAHGGAQPGLWHATSANFATMSLSPSPIDASYAGHWRGSITDGEVLDA